MKRRVGASGKGTQPRLRQRLAWRKRLTPSRVLAGSFLFLILLGTLGLRLLPGIYTGERLGWLDSLFTATSAVCVTGLIVVDTASYFTRFGQAFVLLLIQLGGLGFLTITTVVILALGRKLSLTQRAVVHVGQQVVPEINLRRLMLDIVRFTLVIEGAGALLLFVLWAPRLGAGAALWHAVFQSISAFCNAGFSTFSDSLVGFQRSPATLVVMMVLIVIGGLGFLTLEEVALRRTKIVAPRGMAALSIHSRLVLAVTAILLLGGAVLYGLFEWRNTLAPLGTVDRVANALFMSVTPRTAGFNTVDYAQTTEASTFLTILMMSVGGSPGSTAGGLKTTTAAVIFLLAWSRLRGQAVTSIWRRTIPEETIQRAVGLFVFGFALVTGAVFLYMLTEIGLAQHDTGRFLAYMFEAVSAFNTVGLSMGVTPELSHSGRLLTVLLMYIGRVGPLAFAAAIALREPTVSARFRYAYGDVVIG